MSGRKVGIFSFSVRSPALIVSLFMVHWSWTKSDVMFAPAWPTVPKSSTS